MKKSKQYKYTRFSADALRKAIQVFQTKTNQGKPAWSVIMSVDVGDSAWQYDSSEEFFADYRKADGGATYLETNDNATVQLVVHTSMDDVLVQVAAPDRGSIEAVFEVFERHAASSRLPVPKKKPPDPPTIFIGHGGSPQWRDLKDHLHEKHAYRVEAYEIGARAGHAIRDVLHDMLSKSSFAILVMTGEDQTSDGVGLRARQNVVHEAGLFQGRLGFARAIVLLEGGVEEFSNIHGIDQIRFDKGRIKETFGDVVATIRREFPEGAA
jgi:predicted nucleotide-binding protein